MATVRESDTSLWLHNKLGDNEDLWSGISSISTQLKGEVLQNIHACFQGLHPTVKLKMLMSILHMPRRNMDEFQKELSSILSQALTDSDQWVSTIATILLPYPSTGRLNMDIEHTHPFLADILKDLRKTLRETDSNTLLPLECQYLNRNALTQLVGMQAPLVKHFALKRKPKSAALRAELLQKSQEAAQNKKPTMPSPLPMKRSMVRKISDDGPLRGIPKATPGFRPTPSSVNRSMPLNRNVARITVNREGGTKMLDITEQPIGGGSREAKRRKKQAELEAQEQAKKEKETVQAATPDYAASLMSPAVAQTPAAVPTPAATTTSEPTPTTPSYAPSATITNPITNPATPAPILSNLAQQPAVNPSAATVAARENLQQQLQQSLQQNIQPQYGQPSQPTQQPNLTPTPTPTPPTVTTPTQPQPTLQPPPPYPQPTVPGLMSSIPGYLNTTAPSIAIGVGLTPTVTVTNPGANPGGTGAAGGAGPKKGLSLTREQMLAAQEMFRQSNKVTRPEKALILGFMAGARENPCPQQGNIVTIRLSENREAVNKDGVLEEMLVDTYFEMNYATGEWRRYKKYKPMV